MRNANAINDLTDGMRSGPELRSWQDPESTNNYWIDNAIGRPEPSRFPRLVRKWFQTGGKVPQEWRVVH